VDRGGLSRLAAVAANTFRETVRERVLYNLVFFAILMILSGFLLSELSIRQEAKIIKDLGLSAMDVFGSLIAIFMGVGLVSKEIDRRSLYPLLAKPLSRTEFFLGKFAGLGLTLLVNLTVMAVGMTVSLALAGHGPGGLLMLEGVYAIYLGLLLVVALALFFSTATSSAMAAVATVAIVVAGRFSDVVRNMREVMPGAPRWLVSAVYYALPNFRNFDFKDRVAYGDALPAGSLTWVSLYAAAYIALLLGAGLWSFRRRDLN
jgi:ABC-type transport system involved in multi-copper enzyme maturation permease subunit